MAVTKVITFLFLLLLLLSTPSSPQSTNGGHLSILVSQTGIQFVKDFLIKEVISTTIPLNLPEINKEVNIPFIGNVQMGLSNIQIYAVDLKSSRVETTGGNGIVLSITGGNAGLRMGWSYNYKASFFHVSDHGHASVKVNGMDVKITVSLVSANGSLKIATRASNCAVKSIDFHIDGSASWLYQGVVGAFEKKIISTVEETVSKKILEKMAKLDSLLRSIPKEKKIDESAAVNLTFIGNPVLGDSSVGVGIDGMFLPNGGVGSKVSEHRSSSFVSGINKMLQFAVEEPVFNSATLVYFNAKQMHMVVNETENGSSLSTSDWKLIFPELYVQFPDVKMMLNVSVTSPPSVNIQDDGIGAGIHLEMLIGVQNSRTVLSAATISLALNVGCFAEIADNSLAGSLRLRDFNATIKWTKTGRLQASNVQDVVSKILKSSFFPYVNTLLKRGYRLPIPHGFRFENTEVVYAQNRVILCTDLASSSTHSADQIIV